MKELEPEAVNVQVTEEDLAKVIELWTGIPSSRIRENELAKLHDLEEKLKQKDYRSGRSCKGSILCY